MSFPKRGYSSSCRSRRRVSISPRRLVTPFLEILHRGNFLADGRRQLPRHPVGGHTNGLSDVLQGVLNDRTAAALAKQEPDGGAIDWRPHNFVYSRDIEVQFAGMFRLTLNRLKFDHEVAVQAEMIEKQVDIKAPATHLQRHLTADESEAATQLQEEVAQVSEQTPLQFPLLGG
jgi:hypothetical protein